MRLKQKITSKQKLLIYAVSGLIIILIYNLLVVNFSTNNHPDRIVSKFQSEFLQQQEQLADKSGIVSEILKNESSNHWNLNGQVQHVGNISSLRHSGQPEDMYQDSGKCDQ